MNYFKYLAIILSCFSFLGAAQPQYKADIDAFKLKVLQDKGAVVIDIRTKPEWYETGIIKGSVPITFFQANGGYDIDAFMKALMRAVPDKQHPLIIICRTGNRSVPVADFLARVGYQNVYNQKRGIVEWIGRGLPTVKP
jgi:rhodanese-related sulfurtransferase